MKGSRSECVCRLRKIADTVRGPRAKALRSAARSIQTADELFYAQERTFRGVAEADRAASDLLKGVDGLPPEQQEWLKRLVASLEEHAKIADLGLEVERLNRGMRFYGVVS